MATDYIPLDPEFYDTFNQELSRREPAIVHYFNQKNKWVVGASSAARIDHRENAGEFLTLDSGQKIRIDRIISINGKPGPAFDEYDSYALACLDCQGGID